MDLGLELVGDQVGTPIIAFECADGTKRGIFGPVLTMQVFDTETEAVVLANDSEYGLAASIWTRDVDRPLRIGRDLQVGTVWVNDWAMLRDEFEEGGYKQSGRGRLRGLAALDDFLEYKHIVLNPGVVAPRESAASNESERTHEAQGRVVMSIGR
jgi:acyl-CoA reductase-like NAD-dependent aldehyde dehydrogenase